MAEGGTFPNKEKEEYDDLKINVGNILKNDNGEIKLIDFGPINENEKRSDEDLMKIEIDMLKQVRKEGVTKTYSPRRIKPRELTTSEKKRRREEAERLDDDFIFPYYSGSDSDVSLPSPPKRGRINHTSEPKDFAVRGNLFDGGKKKRRRTKKKRRRKRKSTKKKRKRKRKSTKKKRRRRR